mmetsp:Transcript_12383/g.17657  ORF Transcript_12383/g.17657 Transcript_12383/m.17657 type:complete len:187 (+) Transcript_12383:2649-3209(+)
MIIAESTKQKTIPKTLDFQQAFCQSILPQLEKYVLTPPHGCPIMPPNTYLLLKKTLYGLKRSPRHRFLKATEILESVGLKPITNSRCIFQGHLIPGQPPLTLGLYVDDCIYFSESREVEELFETRVQKESNNKITFMGRITHFLGIKFDTMYCNNNAYLFMSQTAFIESLAGMFNIQENPSVTSPH